MEAPLQGTLSVSLHESELFSKLSGDYNPLHIEPVLARRTRFGGTVVHGIHLFIRALDRAVTLGLLKAERPAKLSVTFDNPVLTDSPVHLRAVREDGKLQLAAEAAGQPAFRAMLFVEPAIKSPSEIPDAESQRFRPREVDFPPSIRKGEVPLLLNRSILSELFPSLCMLAEHDWIADLVVTSQIVGMHCPGMHSIYSSLHLHRSSLGCPNQAMHFNISGIETRFQLLRIDVNGSCLAGSIEAFFRPRPVMQRSFEEVSETVESDAFVGARPLVIGGSRGLGELTAKILAAGGADVTITYCQGLSDAELICADVVNRGHRCVARQLDLTKLRDFDSTAWLSLSEFSHVYFFASPAISMNVHAWDDRLFSRFLAVYVSAFAELAERLAMAGSSTARILYPSSIFVTSPELGFAEYAAAKAAGEALCSQLRARHGYWFAIPRLPRMRTDQTSSLSDLSALDPLPIMLEVARQMHA